MSDKMKGLHILIFGRVQGVFFRASSKEQADLIGVKGWVRNRRDKTVEIHAYGKEEDLQQLLAWCSQGSRFSRVDKVEHNNLPWEKCTDFVILPTV